jgi:hypothetical protein
VHCPFAISSSSALTIAVCICRFGSPYRAGPLLTRVPPLTQFPNRVHGRRVTRAVGIAGSAALPWPRRADATGQSLPPDTGGNAGWPNHNRTDSISRRCALAICAAPIALANASTEAKLRADCERTRVDHPLLAWALVRKHEGCVIAYFGGHAVRSARLCRALTHLICEAACGGSFPRSYGTKRTTG